MRTRRTRLWNLVISSGAILWAGCAGGGDPILLGLAGPFSQPRGASMRLAAELAVAEINREGGVRGRRFALVIRDDSGQSAAAVRIANEFRDTPGLVAVIGHLNSGATLAAAPVYNGGDDPVLEISPSASSPEISDAGPYTFRVCPDDRVHGARLAEWAWNRLNASGAAVLYRNNDYGRGVWGAFASNFRTMGGDLVSEDPYVPSLPTFEPYLRRVVVRGGADVLMIAGSREGAERILPVVRSVGLGSAVLGGDGLTGLEAVGERADGVYISSAYLPDAPDERNRAFVSAYRRTYEGRLPDHRGAGAYDIVYLLARAIDAVGTDRRAVRDYVAGVGSETAAFEGVTGTIAFDANGDVPDKEVVIGIVRDGRLVIADGR